MQYAIRVKPDYQFNQAQVGGRGFTKAQAVLLNEVEVTDEIRNSSLLVIEPVAEPTPLQVEVDIHPRDWRLVAPEKTPQRKKRAAEEAHE
jgi:hypothetical protein